ncbi:MAG: DUF4158 domain-containing protein [Bryobacteraceae bacterium]
MDRLDKSEVERLIRSTYQSHNKYGLMIKTLFLSGARVDEFVHIRVEDLHLDGDPPQIYLSHCKKESNRYVPVLPALAQELRTHLNGRRYGYLFETNRNDRYSVRTVQSVVKSEAREAGIDKRVYPHLLRHSIATILLDSGEVPIDQVQKFLGTSATLDDADLRRDQHSSAGRKLSARHGRCEVLSQMAAVLESPAPNDRLEEPDRLPDGIDDDTLRKYFTLTRPDLDQVDQCRGAINKLGFAVQLCTVRWRGYFLPDTRGFASPVIEMIGSQLGLLPISLDDYPQNEKTRFEHLERIRQHLGFVRCDAPQRERLLNHLTAIAQGLTRATALRQAAHRWLKQEQIVRPGHTTLRDVIVSAREAALQNVYAILAKELSPKQVEEIEALLIVAATAPESAQPEAESASRSRLEQFKAVARKESPESLLALLEQLSDVRSLGLTAWPALAEIHPATRRMLAGWGYRYSVWNLRRFSVAKRNGIVIGFLQAARAEMTDGIVEMQDKLITSIHNKARKRYEELLRATEEARSRVVEVLEEMGTLVLDDSIPDEKLRKYIFDLLPSEDISRLVEGCRNLRAGATALL